MLTEGHPVLIILRKNEIRSLVTDLRYNRDFFFLSPFSNFPSHIFMRFSVARPSSRFLRVRIHVLI